MGEWPNPIQGAGSTVLVRKQFESMLNEIPDFPVKRQKLEMPAIAVTDRAPYCRSLQRARCHEVLEHGAKVFDAEYTSIRPMFEGITCKRKHRILSTATIYFNLPARLARKSSASLSPISANIFLQALIVFAVFVWRTRISLRSFP